MLDGGKREMFALRMHRVLDGPTFAMDDDPAVVFGDMLSDLLARELDLLFVVAVAIHCGGDLYGDVD
jgi:hypothetical protein